MTRPSPTPRKALAVLFGGPLDGAPVEISQADLGKRWIAVDVVGPRVVKSDGGRIFWWNGEKDREMRYVFCNVKPDGMSV